VLGADVVAAYARDVDFDGSVLNERAGDGRGGVDRVEKTVQAISSVGWLALRQRSFFVRLLRGPPVTGYLPLCDAFGTRFV